MTPQTALPSFSAQYPALPPSPEAGMSVQRGKNVPKALFCYIQKDRRMHGGETNGKPGSH
jgi:hypothetical protein